MREIENERAKNEDRRGSRDQGKASDLRKRKKADSLDACIEEGLVCFAIFFHFLKAFTPTTKRTNQPKHESLSSTRRIYWMMVSVLINWFHAVFRKCRHDLRISFMNNVSLPSARQYSALP